MSVQKLDATYSLILNTAKDIFFKQGKFNATTQEIADAAGVNRTLINYYFRSRNNLFDIVFNDAREEQEKKQELIFRSNLPLKDKMSEFIDLFLENALMYPYKQIYVATQITQQNTCSYPYKENSQDMLETFYIEIQEEMNKGNIEKMEPVQFFLNFISLLSFPISMRPLIQHINSFSDAQYDQILAQRKEVILKTLFKK